MPDRTDCRDESRIPDASVVERTHELLFAGLSIMNSIPLLHTTLFVACPGCGAAQTYSATSPSPTFVHRDDQCPVLHRIQTALGVLSGVRG